MKLKDLGKAHPGWNRGEEIKVHYGFTPKNCLCEKCKKKREKKAMEPNKKKQKTKK